MGFKKIKHEAIKLPKKAKLYRQTYEKALGIKNVQILKMNTFADDFGGWFKETLRLDKDGYHVALKELDVKFRPVQANISLLAPKTKRFWHIHYSQSEIWTTTGTIILGLIDFRPESPTFQTKMKIVLSADKMVYIPAGVAHGFINPNQDFVTLNYFTDRLFVANENTEECRIDPKEVPFDFVKPEIM